MSNEELIKLAFEAREKAYDNIEKIAFEGMQYRKEIGIVGTI